ncbi:hypothetical protein HSX11_08850 [Oxalobacteraceae bacterium]|nr:hypothetical protein [Oxalobacteraceae bacterium]
MANYNKEYFFVQQSDDDRLPLLTATENTMNRNYLFEIMDFGSPPLIFFNGAKEYQKKFGIVGVKDVANILFNGVNLLVCSKIRDELISAEVKFLHMHPAVYIDDFENRHEDYWFLTFTERFDCWDREKSDYEIDPVELGNYRYHSVYSYSLDVDLIEQTPMDERLLFKLGGTQDAFVVCHKSLATLFSGNGKNGVQLVAVDEF